MDIAAEKARILAEIQFQKQSKSVEAEGFASFAMEVIVAMINELEHSQSDVQSPTVVDRGGSGRRTRPQGSCADTIPVRLACLYELDMRVAAKLIQFLSLAWYSTRVGEIDCLVFLWEASVFKKLGGICGSSSNNSVKCQDLIQRANEVYANYIDPVSQHCVDLPLKMERDIRNRLPILQQNVEIAKEPLQGSPNAPESFSIDESESDGAVQERDEDTAMAQHPAVAPVINQPETTAKTRVKTGDEKRTSSVPKTRSRLRSRKDSDDLAAADVTSNLIGRKAQPPTNTDREYRSPSAPVPLSSMRLDHDFDADGIDLFDRNGDRIKNDSGVVPTLRLIPSTQPNGEDDTVDANANAKTTNADQDDLKSRTYSDAPPSPRIQGLGPVKSVKSGRRPPSPMARDMPRVGAVNVNVKMTSKPPLPLHCVSPQTQTHTIPADSRATFTLTSLFDGAYSLIMKRFQSRVYDKFRAGSLLQSVMEKWQNVLDILESVEGSVNSIGYIRSLLSPTSGSICYGSAALMHRLHVKSHHIAAMMEKPGNVSRFDHSLDVIEVVFKRLSEFVLFGKLSSQWKTLESVLFYLDIEIAEKYLSTLPPASASKMSDVCLDEARLLWRQYLDHNAPLEINVDDAARRSVNEFLTNEEDKKDKEKEKEKARKDGGEDGDESSFSFSDVFGQSQAEIFRLIHNDIYTRFKRTNEHKQLSEALESVLPKGYTHETIATFDPDAFESDEKIREHFSLPPSEYLVDSHPCTLYRAIPIHGRILRTPRFLLFRASVFAFGVQECVAIGDIRNVILTGGSVGEGVGEGEGDVTIIVEKIKTKMKSEANVNMYQQHQLQLQHQKSMIGSQGKVKKVKAKSESSLLSTKTKNRIPDSDSSVSDLDPDGKGDDDNDDDHIDADQRVIDVPYYDGSETVLRKIVLTDVTNASAFVSALAKQCRKIRSQLAFRKRNLSPHSSSSSTFSIPMLMSDGEWSSFLEGAERMKFRFKGDVVLKENNPSEGIFQVIRGSVRVEMKSQHRLLARLHPGDIFGEISMLLEGGVASASVIADEDNVLICFISREFIKSLSDDLGYKLYRYLSKLIGTRLRHRVINTMERGDAAFRLSPDIQTDASTGTGTANTSTTVNANTTVNVNVNEVQAQAQAKTRRLFKSLFELPDTEHPLAYMTSTMSSSSGRKRNGDLFISHNYLCFSYRVFGLKSKKTFSFSSIVSIVVVASELEITLENDSEYIFTVSQSLGEFISRRWKLVRHSRYKDQLKKKKEKDGKEKEKEKGKGKSVLKFRSDDVNVRGRGSDGDGENDGMSVADGSYSRSHSDVEMIESTAKTTHISPYSFSSAVMLANDDYHLLLTSGIKYRFSAGQCILPYGAQNRTMFRILTGSCREVVVDALSVHNGDIGGEGAGNRTGIAIGAGDTYAVLKERRIEEGEFFGMMSVFEPEINSITSVFALEDVELLGLDSDTLMKLMKIQNGFGVRCSKMVAALLAIQLITLEK